MASCFLSLANASTSRVHGRSGTSRWTLRVARVIQLSGFQALKIVWRLRQGLARPDETPATSVRTSRLLDTRKRP